MAKFQVSCPGCRKEYQVDDSLVGKRARCNQCQTRFVLEAPEDPAGTWSSLWPWVSGSSRRRTVATPPARPEGPPPAEDGVPETWNPGDVILDLYEVREVFTSGGMGLVYRVRHRGWNVDLAVKCPRPEFFRNDQDKENFKLEAETWVKLGLHAHTVNCYYVRQMGGIPRVFAEFVGGGSLAQWIRQKKLYAGGPDKALERIVDVAIQFAWGLQHAHEQGLVHRDVKPGNVLLTPEGVVKVTDFGMAKARGATAEPNLGGGTRSVLVSAGGMTPAFCSPEQMEHLPLSRKTDLWSWGVSVLEMFTGGATWSAGALAGEVLKNYLTQGPPDARLPRLPAPLAELLRCCFQRQPDARPGDMLEIVTVLRDVYRQATGKAYAREAPVQSEALADSLNNRAVSLLDLNKQAEAEQLWLEALATGPNHPESTYNLNLHRWRTGRLSGEILVQKLQEAGASHPGKWLPQYLLAHAHLELGNWRPAAEALEKIAQAGVQLDEVDAALAVARERLAGCGRCLHVFAGHTDWVSSVSLSADGSLGLSGSADGTLKLWEVSSGRCLRTLHGHTEWVTCVCLSPDGRLALSGSADRTVRLWETATGQCLCTLGEHAKWVTGVALSSDGRYGLSAGGEGQLKLWEVATGKALRSLDGHSGPVISLALGSDGRQALSGGRDNTLKLWDTQDGQCLRVFTGHTDKVLSVCLSPDGRQALSGSGDRTVKLWDLETGRCVRTFQGHTEGVFSVSVSANGRFALSASGDKTIKLWRLALERCLGTLEGHTGPVHSVCLSADGRLALSGSGDKTLRLWSLPRDWTAPYQVARVQASATALAHRAEYEQALARAWQELANGDTLAAVRWVREARAQPGYERRPEAMHLWHGLYVRLARRALKGGWEGNSLEGHADAVTSVCVSQDGRYFLSGGADCTVKLWEAATGHCLRTFEGHIRVITAVCLGRGGRLILSGSADDTLKLWETATGHCLRTFSGHSDLITAAALSADGKYAISASGDRTVKLWDVEGGRCLRTYTGHTDPVHAVAFSPDERFLLSGGAQFLLRNANERLFTSGQFKLWETATGRCLPTFEGQVDPVTAVGFSSDGCFALSGGGNTVLQHQTGKLIQSGQLCLWDLATGHCVRGFAGHADAVTSACLTADGRHLLSGSTDKTLKLWETATGLCLRTFEGHAEAVTSVGVSGDARFILSGSADGALKLWMLDWELEANAPADWDEGALPYLENFLTLHTPYAAALPTVGRRSVKDIVNLPLARLFKTAPAEEEIALALTRRGRPLWTAEDFEELLYTLGCAGYGWLRPEGVRRQLEEMARQ
jgi:WD40 repeat protein